MNMGVDTGLAKTFAKNGKNRLYMRPTTQETAVNALSDLSMKTEDVLRVELELFRREHADLNESIDALQSEGRADMLTLQRLKRRKLMLKDRIRQIEDRLTPDIIA